MRQDLYKFIQPVIDNHKKGIGNRMDWAYAHKEITELQKQDKDAVRLGMIELDIIEPHPAGQNAYTILKKDSFDIVEYEKTKERESSKKWYDAENARLQYESFPKVQCRANWAIIISILSLLATIVLGILKLKQ